MLCHQFAIERELATCEEVLLNIKEHLKGYRLSVSLIHMRP
jgi:hypothetical protein